MISEHPCTEDGWDVVSEDWWLTAPDFASWSFPETSLERERWTTRYKKPPHRPEELLSAPPGLKPSASLSPAESGERLSDTLLGVTRAEDTLRSYEAQERIADDSFPTEPPPFPVLDEDAPEVAYRSWCEQVEALFDGIQDEPPVPSSPPYDAATPRPRRQRRQVSASTSSTSSSPFSLDFSPSTSTTSLFPSEAASSQTSLPSRSPSPKPLDLSDADWPALTSTPVRSRLRKDSEGYYALASPSPSPRKKREAASRTRTLVDRIRSQEDRTRDTDLAAIERKLNQYKDLSSLVLEPELEPETEIEEPEPELEQKPYVDWRAVTSGVKNVFGASMPGPGFDDDDDLHMLQLELDDETGKPRTTHDLVASFFQTPKPAPAEAQPETPLFQPASPSVVEIRAPPPKTRRSRKERRSEGWIEGPREGWIGMEKPAAPPVPPIAPHQRSASVLSGRVPLSTKPAPPPPPPTPMFTQPFGPAYPGYAYPYPVPVVYQYAPTGLMAIPLGATHVQVPVLPPVPVTITGTSGIRHAV